MEEINPEDGNTSEPRIDEGNPRRENGAVEQETQRGRPSRSTKGKKPQRYEDYESGDQFDDE